MQLKSMEIGKRVTDQGDNYYQGKHSITSVVSRFDEACNVSIFCEILLASDISHFHDLVEYVPGRIWSHDYSVLRTCILQTKFFDSNPMSRQSPYEKHATL